MKSMRTQLKTRNTGIDGRLPNHYSNFHIWKIGSYIYVTFLNTISINNLYTLKIISFRAIQREIYILILTSKCFLFWCFNGYDSNHYRKKTATRIGGFFLQYLLPLYPHEPITKPYHLTSVRVSKRADCWMQKNSVGQLRGRYYASVKRPCRELVPRRLTSALGDVCCGPKRSIVR